MCATCGCSIDHEHGPDEAHTHEHAHAHEHTHDHDHAHGHGHSHTHEHGHTHAHGHDHTHEHGHAHANGHTHTHERGAVDEVARHNERLRRLEEAVLSRNAALAEENRAWFRAQAITTLNVVSSPGSGKTTLLERLITDTGSRRPLYVIQGDQATDRDAARIRAAGGRAVQINTGTGCHLDARMVERALAELNVPRGALLVIENVGNLVCPALFDLGEAVRVAVASVTEGADKPLKYPYLFRGCQLVLLNKTDLLPYVSFDQNEFYDDLRRVNPDARCLPISATQGEGLDAFYEWIDRACSAAAASPMEVGR
jgi:hydrogenase nickel incorporation protein HypB